MTCTRRSNIAWISSILQTIQEGTYSAKKKKKVVGKMKDETGGKLFTSPLILHIHGYFNFDAFVHAFHFVLFEEEFPSLRPKMYSFTNVGKAIEVKKAKGISKSVVSKDLVYQNYVDCLYNCELERHTMNSVRSEKHDLYLKAINKISLSPFDDKRYWLAPHGVEGYSYGHYKIKISK
jgi:hypothetical protein